MNRERPPPSEPAEHWARREVKDGILRLGSRSGRTYVTFIEFRKL